MIIVKLMGGLGNQMFQYAAGRRLALLRDVPLKLDISDYNLNKLRSYKLDHFNIVASFASNGDIQAIKRVNIDKKGPIVRLIQKMGIDNIYSKSSYFQELAFNYDRNFLKLPKDVYISGYWQSERYFIDIGDVIRQDFSFKDSNFESKVISEEIRSSSSVSVHIRRGDYVTNSHTNKYHGTCSLDYYNKAVKYIGKKVDKPLFYIFSDDIDWVEKNLTVDYPMTVISNQYSCSDIEDLRLMSMCKHHIIANSSFSWWGAWLGKKDDGIIIAPKKWFNLSKNNTKDLIPKSWQRI